MPTTGKTPTHQSLVCVQYMCVQTTWFHTRYGPPDVLLSTPWFWLVLLAMYAITGGGAVLFRTAMWVFAPQDSMIVSEMEAKVRLTCISCVFLHTTAQGSLQPVSLVADSSTAGLAAPVAPRRASKVYPAGMRLCCAPVAWVGGCPQQVAAPSPQGDDTRQEQANKKRDSAAEFTIIKTE